MAKNNKYKRKQYFRLRQYLKFGKNFYIRLNLKRLYYKKVKYKIRFNYI